MMQKNFLYILLSTLIIINIIAQDEDDDLDDFELHTIGRTFFNPRSQGSCESREFVGLMEFYYQPCLDFTNFVFAITGDFNATYRNKRIGDFLFFNGNNIMNFGNIDANADIFGQNFLLNNDVKAFISASPHVSNIITDFSLYIGFDGWVQNLYYWVHAPLCRTHWNIDFNQVVENPGTVIPANSLGNPTDEPAPFVEPIAAWSGQKTFFDVKQPLQFARVDGARSKTRVADVEMALGYNFVNRDDTHFGLQARLIIPTGNRPQGIFFFEPIVGNGHHFELGFGLSAHTELWNCSDNQVLYGYLQGALYHVFGSHQRRTFDLIVNGIGSRYLLFKKFDSSTNLYAGEIVRGPNILTLRCNVANDIHADAFFMLDYHHNNWVVDAGYNVWARSFDKIKITEQIPLRTYGVAGTTGTDPLGNRDRTASLTTISGEHASEIDPINVYISNADINIISAQHPNVFAHAFFGYFGYNWDCLTLNPILGIGTQIEFSGQHGRALNLWHIWLKGGLTF